MRFGRFVQLGLLATLLGSGSIGCGSVDIPVDLALVGDNTISIEAEGSPPLATTLVGGVETTISADLGLFSLLNPNGIMAGITVDDLLFAGENIPILEDILNTGTLCIEQNPDNPGGGSAHMRLLQGQADFLMALNTLIRGTDPGFVALLDALGYGAGFPFDTVVEAYDVPFSLVDMLGLLSGTSSGGLEINQDISTTLPADIPFFGGATVNASLTLATVDAIPVVPPMADCATP
jgi:hypothetical protein